MDRFWSKVEIRNIDECWLWQASKTNAGYGQFWCDDSLQLAHRISWKIHYGEIPIGMLVCHKCDTPSCVNPNHLWLGTSNDNMQDKMKKNRGKWATGIQSGAYTHPEKRPHGDSHGKTKLSSNDIQEIRTKHMNENLSAKELSDIYNISYVQMWRILHNNSRKD